MAEFKISRFRYTWRGDWIPARDYIKDDIVRYGGSSYVCVMQHTSVSNFYTDLYYTPPGETAQTPRWIENANGLVFTGEWTTGTYYNLGDTAHYKSFVYFCIAPHTSSAEIESDLATKWIIYSRQINWKGDWQINLKYVINDVVKYGGVNYICVETHLSSSSLTLGLEQDDSKWQEYFENIEFKGSFSGNTLYRKNDLVEYRGSIFRSNQLHTSSAAFSPNDWTMELPGSRYEEAWSNSFYYGRGSVVRYGGYLYIALLDNINQNPFESTYQPTAIFWKLFNKGIRFLGTWLPASQYKVGDVVRRGGNLYVAKLDTVSDGSSLDYLDISNWELLIEGQEWRSSWSEGTLYGINDLVSYKGSVYKSTVAHQSTAENYPGDNGNGFDFWDFVLESVIGETGLSQRGDLLTFDLSREDTGDGSTFGLVAAPIGNRKEVLSIDNDDGVFYRTYGLIARVRYVDSTLGIDDNVNPSRGTSSYYPWKTIRYACEQVNDGFEGTTTVNVETGLYYETLPIIIPPRTAVRGSELRSVTVEPAAPAVELATDSGFTISILNRLSTLLTNLLIGNTVIKTAANPLDPVILYQEDSTLLVTNAVILEIQDRIDDIIDYISFRLESGSTDPTVTGSNSPIAIEAYINATLILEANKEFLAAEAVAFVQTTFPTYSFDAELRKINVKRYVDAWKYDIIYTGNYRSVLEGRYYVNSVLGSETEDMFYCRNSTGVRNMTLKGLNGILNAPVLGTVFRRPSGGAFVSLDPGWGPADQSTWITTRSPYIQGVTTFGYAATGQKIDGALHNGGNRSIVSNDFTQVISDGIGAHILNQGRAELVSVFSYYAHIGYLAENGGTIRATNGNSSYGDFGVIAEGIDATETPAQALTNNRNQQAIVSSAFAGEFVDEIQILEWTNAGEGYTQAAANFVGAGFAVSTVFDDFRDNAVFEARAVDLGVGAQQIFGGANYTISQNNAQVSPSAAENLDSIVISQSDNKTTADYLGKRIIIVGGTGTGQYGYISNFNESTKKVSVSRESDNQPGWDNIISGRLPKIPLDTTTVYRIEPRVIFSAPEYSASNFSVPASADWLSGAYGPTTETFSNITVNVDGSTVSPNFDIIKTGNTYTVILQSGGSGYNIGNEITILGNLVGGLTPNNDITVEVTGIDIDANDAITTFVVRGRPNNGKFVVINSGGTGVVSMDSVAWSSFALPSSGNWIAAAAGTNRFVAIKKSSSEAAYSLQGSTWISAPLPSSREWEDVVFGNDKFVAVASNLNAAAYSSDGITWTATTLPVAGDSTINEWCAIAYGKGTFVAVARSQNISARSSDGINWTAQIMDSIDDSSQKDWTSIAYGNNRFVAISSQGDISYSFEGEAWVGGTLPINPEETQIWKKIRYAQGVFLAIGETDIISGISNFIATSTDGVYWVGRTLASYKKWNNVIFGNPIDAQLDSSVGLATPTWVLLPDGSDEFNRVRAGKTAVGRPIINAGKIQEVKLWDPGSGYSADPSITFVDSGATSAAIYEPRIGDGVLSNPSWINRGTGYRTSTTRVTITGNGFADVIPLGNFVTVSGLNSYFGPGAQITFQSTAQIYTVVAIEELGQITTGSRLSARLRVTPPFRLKDKIQHGTAALIRLRYSQARITGHDFLDIGTGNFVNTNYPELYSGFYEPAPENEVVETNGGRVFYTSTDQSGNFRVGELFNVEQSTGIVSISSDFFDLQGLSEVRLGGFRIGGSGVVVREFSKDPLFIADSNSVVPTQRAIRTFLANRLTVGGSEVATSSFIAGQVLVGPARIQSTIGSSIVVRARVDFFGAVRGAILAQTMFYRSFT